LLRMIKGVIGQKVEQTQRFLSDGKRIPVTVLAVSGNTVLSVRDTKKHGYNAVQIGFGTKKKATKAQIGNGKGAGLKTAPKLIKEVRTDEIEGIKAGDAITASTVLKAGDIVDALGISKGKGFAGGVKRYHFKGGPRTHGQSNRERAPGSIGQTTTPGRVYKGKRMAGRMGQDRVTVKNLEVVSVTDDTVLLKGLVPGSKNTLIFIKKVGESKKFTPLYEEKVEEVEKVGTKEEGKDAGR